MSKEELIRLIDRLPADKLDELKRRVISMLSEATQPAPPHEPVSFEEAQDYTFKTIDKTLKKLTD